MDNRNWGPRVKRTTNPTQMMSAIYKVQSDKMSEPGFCPLPNDSAQESTDNSQDDLIDKYRILRQQLNNIADKLRNMGINPSVL